MKKYIYGLFFALISVAMFTACSAEMREQMKEMMAVLV